MFERDRSDDPSSGWWMWLSSLAPARADTDDPRATHATPAPSDGRARRVGKRRRA